MFKRSLSPSVAIASVVLAAVSVTGCSNDDKSSSVSTIAASSATDSGSSDPGSSGAAEAVRLVSPADAEATIESAPAGLTIIDVRTPEEFAQGHLDGAINIDFYAPDFAEKVNALAKDTPYVIYCQSGNRSGQARALMAPMGFKNLEDVDGGISAWKADGLPVVTD